MIPSGCGLNASSAFAAAFALAVKLMYDFDQFRSDFSRLENPGDLERVIAVRTNDHLWDVYKLAWSLDNVFHLGASSGCGSFASIFGSADGFPLIYVGETRGFSGGYPFYFGGGGKTSSLCDKEFKRIRSTGYRSRTFALRSEQYVEYGLCFTRPRDQNTNIGAMIRRFLQQGVGQRAGQFLEEIAKDPRTKHDFRREVILELAHRKLTDNIDTYQHPLSPEPVPDSACRDVFVEWMAESLGCISLACTMAFLELQEKVHAKGHVEVVTDGMKRFLRYVNAYQEILSAAGVSCSTLDLYNYRADLFRCEEGAAAYAYGTKLTGGGGGGDLLVAAPAGDLQVRILALRRKLGVGGGGTAPCHCVSWAPESIGVRPTVKGWRLLGNGLAPATGDV